MTEKQLSDLTIYGLMVTEKLTTSVDDEDELKNSNVLSFIQNVLVSVFTQGKTL